MKGEIKNMSKPTQNGKKPTQIKGRSWMVTVQIQNMINAGLTEEQYMNYKEVADYFINLWTSSGKNRKAGAAVCTSKDGLYHMHMACYTRQDTTMNQVIRILYKSHVDLVQGTKEELRAYLEKTGEYEEKGETVHYTIGLENIEDNRGKRNDLDDMEDLIHNNMKPREILERKFRYGKYSNMLKEAYIAKRLKETPLIKEMHNEYHWGAPGTGKTYTYIKLCEEHSPDDVYICSDYSNSGGSGGGFDKYMENAAKIVILDEFRGNIPFNQLLTILDVYSRNQIHCRYQNVYCLWTSVIICTVYPPERVYSFMVDDTKRSVDSIKQFLRRLDLIVYHYKNDRGEYKTFSMKPSEYISDIDMINKARINEMREESIRLKEEAKQTECEDISANNSEENKAISQEEAENLLVELFGKPPEETTNTEKEEVKNNEE